MTKQLFIKTIMQSLECKKQTAENIYNTVHKYMLNTFLEYGKIKLPKIGTISLVERKSSIYRNPYTKELSSKPKSKNVKFVISSLLKRIINQPIQ